MKRARALIAVILLFRVSCLAAATITYAYDAQRRLVLSNSSASKQAVCNYGAVVMFG